MKKKGLLSAIMTIVLCLSIIAGSTYALFTSRSELNIAVTAGKVDMVAGVTVTSVESVEGDVNGTIVDEFGSTYSYSYSDAAAPYNFINGGEAKVDGAVLTVDRITPGDKINIAVSGTNTSDIPVKYRYIVECIDGYKLMDGLTVYVGGGTYTSMASFTSVWTTLAAGTDMPVENISIELPVDAGNEYQRQNTKIRIIVEAVQANGVVDTNTQPTVVNIPKVDNINELKSALQNPEIPAINILEDIADTVTVDYDISNKTIFVNGNDASFNFTKNVENVEIIGIKNDTEHCSINVSGATGGSLTVLDSTFKSTSGANNPSIYLGSNVSVKAENCTFTNGSGKGYGIRGNSSADLTVINCEFYNYTSWPIIVNGKADGDVKIDGCTFDTKAGVFKTLGDGITGDFTFTNNTMKAPGDNNDINKVVVSGSGNGPIICKGTVTSENNTLNGSAWTVNVLTTP